MWGFLSAAAGGSHSTDSGFGDFSGGNFGNVNIGAPQSGASIDQKSLIIFGVVAVVIFAVMKKGK